MPIEDILNIPEFQIEVPEEVSLDVSISATKKKAKLDPKDFIEKNFEYKGTVIISENASPNGIRNRIEVGVYTPKTNTARNAGYRTDTLYALLPAREGCSDMEIIDLDKYNFKPFKLHALKVEIVEEAHLTRQKPSKERYNVPPRPSDTCIMKQYVIKAYHDGFLMYSNAYSNRSQAKMALEPTMSALEAFPIRIASADDVEAMKNRRILYYGQLGRVVEFFPNTGEVSIEKTSKSGKGFSFPFQTMYREELAEKPCETPDNVVCSSGLVRLKITDPSIYWGVAPGNGSVQDCEMWSDEQGNPLNRDGTPWVYKAPDPPKNEDKPEKIVRRAYAGNVEPAETFYYSDNTRNVAPAYAPPPAAFPAPNAVEAAMPEPVQAQGPQGVAFPQAVSQQQLNQALNDAFAQVAPNVGRAWTRELTEAELRQIVQRKRIGTVGNNG